MMDDKNIEPHNYNLVKSDDKIENVEIFKQENDKLIDKDVGIYTLKEKEVINEILSKIKDSDKMTEEKVYKIEDIKTVKPDDDEVTDTNVEIITQKEMKIKVLVKTKEEKVYEIGDMEKVTPQKDEVKDNNIEIYTQKEMEISNEISDKLKALEKKSDEDEDEQTIIESSSLEESKALSEVIMNDEDDLLFSQDIESVIKCLTEEFEEEKGIIPIAKSYGEENESIDQVSLLDFPHVSIGFESRDRKSVSTAGSDIESDGELVPCEDKCIGTADFPDISYDNDSVFSDNMYDEDGIQKSDSDVILNLSLSKSDSVFDFGPHCMGKDINERPRSATSPSDMSSSLAVSCDCSESSLLEFSTESNTNSAPKIEDPSPIEIEKEKTPVKKVSKKKSKKNKRDLKAAESGKLDNSSPLKGTPDRPVLLRGKQWKEKGKPTGKEILESLSPDKESTDSLEIDNLDKHCSDKIYPKEQNTLFTEEEDSQKEVENILIDYSLSPVETSKNIYDKLETIIEHGDGDDLCIVRSCDTIVPQVVQTEYLVDSEDSPSSQETDYVTTKPTGKISDDEKTDFNGSYGLEELSDTLDDIPDDHNSPIPGVSNDYSIPGELLEESQCENVPIEPPIYFSDSKIDDVKCDYIQTFPNVIGTEKLVVDYEQDRFRSDFNARWSKKHDMLNQHVEDPCSDVSAEETEHFAGEIVYEGPCSCGDNQSWAKLTVKDVTQVKDTIVKGMGVDSQSQSDLFYNYNLKQGDAISESECDIKDSEQDADTNNDKDIQSRIREILGSRLQREDIPTSDPIIIKDNVLVGNDEAHEESPIMGSSPASSSGVQGSDEMSPSQSRSQSLSRDVSPTSTTYNIPDIAFEKLNLKLGSTTPELLDNSPDDNEKVGFDFSSDKSPGVTRRYGNIHDIYQINPSYTTDSEDPDDPNESDTIEQSPNYHGLDQDPNATVTSWVSTSEESTPTILDTQSSPPHLVYPSFTNEGKNKKVPRVTRLLRETQGIVQRWEVLQTQAVERQRQSGQVRELQRQVKSLRVALEALQDRATRPHHRHDSLDTHDQLADSLSELKEIANEVVGRKSDVSSLNLTVHRFLTETGYTIAPLKDDVADLYRLWDEVNTRVSSEVARLEGVESTWRLWESQAAELRQALRQDQDTLAVLDQAMQTGSISDTLNASAQDVARLLNDRRKTGQPSQARKLMLQHTRTQGVDITGIGGSSLLGEDCASDSGTSGYESCSSEELSERERHLANLRRLARDLEASLSPQSEAWLNITKTLSTAESELRGLQKHCRDLVVRTTENLEQVKPSPVARRRSWNKERGSRTVRPDKRSSVGSESKNISSSRQPRGWMWRVVRAALPFQAALLLLFCVACLLEPNCCDHVNTLNLSFSPQTRYVHGPPPV